MKPPLFTVAETSLFIKQAHSIWSEDEKSDFIDYIARNPHIGDLIPETGGVRKIRWNRQGMGKRGGVRVIYFYYDQTTPLYLLMVYAKSVSETLSPEAKLAVTKLTAALKYAHRH